MAAPTRAWTPKTPAAPLSEHCGARDVVPIGYETFDRERGGLSAAATEADVPERYGFAADRRIGSTSLAASGLLK